MARHILKLPRTPVTSFGVSLPIKLTCAACLIALASLNASGQQTSSSPDKIIKTTSVAVNVYAIAEGRHGRLIHDLSKEDFELTEDAVPQKIEFFSRETDIPLSLGVAIDTSASQGRLLKTEQQAANKFLHSVLRHGDQAFVMSFDVDVNLRQDFTNELRELARAIEDTEINTTGRSILQDDTDAPQGGTHLRDAVYLASNELMKTRYGRKVLVLVTDGEDEGSNISLRKAIEAAEKADLIVYSIVVSDPEFYQMLGAKYHGDASVRRIARETGGRTIRVKAIEQIETAFDRIALELRSQYLLGYSPSNPRWDGSFRRIEVKVRGHNYTVRTRTGYYPHRDERTEAESRTSH
jgi:VWFA-related protein